MTSHAPTPSLPAEDRHTRMSLWHRLRRTFMWLGPKKSEQVELEDQACHFLRWIRGRREPRGPVAVSVWSDLYIRMCAELNWAPLDARSVIGVARLYQNDRFTFLSEEVTVSTPVPYLLRKGALSTEEHAKALVEHLTEQRVANDIWAHDMMVIYQEMCASRNWEPEYWNGVAHHLPYPSLRRMRDKKLKFIYVVRPKANAPEIVATSRQRTSA